MERINAIGIIYIIEHGDGDTYNSYIGSTTLSLHERIMRHKSSVWDERYTSKLYLHMRNNVVDGAINGYRYSIIETIEFRDNEDKAAMKQVLVRAEQRHIDELHPSLNTNRSFCTEEDTRNKKIEYYHAHKEDIIKHNMEYNRQHYEKFKENAKRYYINKSIDKYKNKILECNIKCDFSGKIVDVLPEGLLNTLTLDEIKYLFKRTKNANTLHTQGKIDYWNLIMSRDENINNNVVLQEIKGLTYAGLKRYFNAHA